MDWKEQIDRLAERLDALYASKAKPEELDNGCWFEGDLADDIGWEAYDVLICENRPVMERINYLRTKGYVCRKGESDSFGWLNGIIEQLERTDPRKLCFG